MVTIPLSEFGDMNLLSGLFFASLACSVSAMTVPRNEDQATRRSGNGEEFRMIRMIRTTQVIRSVAWLLIAAAALSAQNPTPAASQSAPTFEVEEATIAS